MEKDINSVLISLLAESQLIKSINELKQSGKDNYLFKEVRSLSAEEVEVLKAKNNRSGDWNRIKVAPDFITEFIYGNTFDGDCILGLFSGIDIEIEKDVVLKSGIFNSTIINTGIADNCLIKDCSFIANYIIKEKAVIINTGSISSGKNCTFGNGIKIAVGMETGGREITSCADINIFIAKQVALKRGDNALQKTYNDFCGRYLEAVTFDYGVVESKAIIRNTGQIKDAYMGEGALIHGAQLIDNCTILSSTDERAEISHGAIVKNSCVQWGCEITSLAIVADSIMTEHSHAGRHGKITASIIGPNTGVAEGEVTSCLVGPFTGFHHQALLIAALWPEGKGNVGYGANVGSNHTSRAPDQEIFCGEGVFFGLGSSIKFPSDFSQAPYSIIATGITTLPQRLEFPFSLIQNASVSSAGISPFYNEIIPAWVLSDNIYMIRRNEEKYKTRNKAKRISFNFTVFRPEIIDMMVKARDRLGNVKKKKKLYNDKDIAGLGKNFLQETNRLKAINSYDFYIEFYCLSGLYEILSELVKADNIKDIASVCNKKTESEVWEHQRNLIKNTGFNKRSLRKNLALLISILEQISEGCFKAREKDDIRGLKIIPDYNEVSVKAEDDSFIKSTRQETLDAVNKIKELMSFIKSREQ